MTTIAYRDGVIAADTCMTRGYLVVPGRVRKIARNKLGDLAGVSGDATWAWAFLAWFEAGEEGEMPVARETDDVIDRAVVFRSNAPRDVIVIEPHGRFEHTAPYYAIGSGADVALGAMFEGATPDRAVAAAVAHDGPTRYPIDVLKHAADEAEEWPAGMHGQPYAIR